MIDICNVILALAPSVSMAIKLQLRWSSGRSQCYFSEPIDLKYTYHIHNVNESWPALSRHKLQTLSTRAAAAVRHM
jgi:hypothetical protein